MHRFSTVYQTNLQERSVLACACRAFGFDVATYIVFSFDRGPNWVVTMSNLFATLQVVGCYQM